jgi:tRNA-guanine family transglycosylase
MQYYIAWTHSDLVYQQFLHDVGVLVSPPNVNLAWTVHKWPSLPKLLIVDSGAYQYNREGRSVTPADALTRQLAIIDGARLPIGICHLDLPMLTTRSQAELDRRVLKSLENAAWLMRYTRENGLPANVEPIGVIQGYSVERVYVSAQSLADMGYIRFAVGSLASLATRDLDEVMRRVEAAVEAVGTNVHVLGVSAIRLLHQIARLGIRSVDSGSPIREAWMGGVYYSRPWRRYKVYSPHFKEWIRSYGFAELLEAPLPCDCPVCQEDSSCIMQPAGKSNINKRALHNCYHLMREFGQLGTEC